jgi:hypothetical protein
MKLQFAMDASKADAGAAWSRVSDSPEVESIVRASGKMLLLHKLLPKLRAEGRQCLIFSQFKVGGGLRGWGWGWDWGGGEGRQQRPGRRRQQGACWLERTHPPTHPPTCPPAACSQIMLDVVEDYLSAAGYPFERIDGNTKQRDRQAAIDRWVGQMGGCRGAGRRARALGPAAPRLWALAGPPEALLPPLLTSAPHPQPYPSRPNPAAS